MALCIAPSNTLSKRLRETRCLWWLPFFPHVRPSPSLTAAQDVRTRACLLGGAPQALPGPEATPALVLACGPRHPPPSTGTERPGPL